MEEFICFHDYVLMILIYIMSTVSITLVSLGMSKWVNSSLEDVELLEVVWTLLPALVLVCISTPSLGMLYSLEEAKDCAVTLKVTGHQWYWSYELSEFWEGTSVVSLDAYMVTSDSEESGSIRLLDTDSRPALPFLVGIRALIGSADVLHSWAVPSLGVKMDATPGRLNQVKLFSYRPGVVYGQCSELCGANHSFMPISLEFVGASDFMTWVASASDN